METRGPAGTTCLKVWNVSYGPRCVEVAAENASRAVEITLAHLGVAPVSGGTLAGLRVNKIDRTIIVEVQ
jgi:hypothetical protein